MASLCKEILDQGVGHILNFVKRKGQTKESAPDWSVNSSHRAASVPADTDDGSNTDTDAPATGDNLMIVSAVALGAAGAAVITLLAKRCKK